MESEIVGLLGILILLILLGAGTSVALACGITGFIGLWFLAGISPAISRITLATYASPASYGLTVIPLFMIMGYFAFKAGVATQAFKAGKIWLARIPGGVAMAAIAGCAFFGACSGSTTASAAVFSKVAIPEMTKLGYKDELSAGVVAASCTFSSMIPPSGIMVLYAVMAEISVGKCLMAGLFPGIITAMLYMLSLFIRVKRNPSLAGGLAPATTWQQKMSAIPLLWGVFVIAGVIIGGIFLGIFTPTEAAAVSAIVGLIMLLSKKDIPRWDSFKAALLDSARTTAMVLFLFIGVRIFATFLAMSQLTYTLIDLIAGLDVNRYAILSGFMILYLIGGTFLNSTGLLLLSMPVVYPIILALGFNPIWFGVLILKTIEVGMVTPPVGVSVYVVQGVSGIKLEDIFRGIFPFIFMDLIVLILLMIFPQIVLFLPDMMK